MLSIAGQRAGPIGLNFLLDTQGWPCYRLKNQKKFFSKFFPFFFKNFFPRATPGPSASMA